jgi:hypothetical protein
LKLKYDEPLSNFDFNFNLHRYIQAATQGATAAAASDTAFQRAARRSEVGLALIHISAGM